MKLSIKGNFKKRRTKQNISVIREYHIVTEIYNLNIFEEKVITTKIINNYKLKILKTTSWRNKSENHIRIFQNRIKKIFVKSK